MSLLSKPMKTKDKAVIVDIDGTLAIKGDRGHFDWMKVGVDTPNLSIVELVKRLATHYEIIIFSGRDSICREITQQWLDKNRIRYLELFMRPEGDMRKDSIVKRELYEAHVKAKYDVLFVLDDRNQVVDMWRNELGLTCLQVAPGDF